MKRSDIATGDVLAYQRTEHDTPQRAEVLDAQPWVLVRLTRKAHPWEADQSDSVSIQVVRLATLRGHYEAVVAARAAAQQERQRAEAAKAERREASVAELSALNERAQALLNVQHTVASGYHQQVTLSRTDFAALLDLAEPTTTKEN